jgi:hypothetical protein
MHNVLTNPQLSDRIRRRSGIEWTGSSMQTFQHLQYTNWSINDWFVSGISTNDQSHSGMYAIGRARNGSAMNECVHENVGIIHSCALKDDDVSSNCLHHSRHKSLSTNLLHQQLLFCTWNLDIIVSQGVLDSRYTGTIPFIFTRLTLSGMKI